MDSTSAAEPGLAGLRVLIVEDEPLISMLIEDALEELQCVSLGPYDTLATAVAAAKSDQFEAALIDFHLKGEKATPLIEVLRDRAIPFAIVSGASPELEGKGEFAVIPKPFKTVDIGTGLKAIIQHSTKAG